MYSAYLLVVLAYLTICNIIFFSNVKSSWAEPSEQVRTCTEVLLKRIFLQRDNNIPLRSTWYTYQLKATSSTSPPAKFVREIPYRYSKCSIRSNKGRYRWTIHKSWLSQNSSKASDREIVRLCLKTIVPEVVERRKAHKLKRRRMYLRDQTSCGV